MNKIKRLKFILIALAVMVSTNSFAAEVEDLIEARQGFMKLYGFNMDTLGDMIRGRTRYDKKSAQDAANNLLALAKMNNAALWPRGSSLADRGLRDKTMAKAELWINRQEVSSLHAELTQAMEILAGNAGWSLESLEDSIRGVNSACKDCHKKFRARK